MFAAVKNIYNFLVTENANVSLEHHHNNLNHLLDAPF